MLDQGKGDVAEWWIERWKQNSFWPAVSAGVSTLSPDFPTLLLPTLTYLEALDWNEDLSCGRVTSFPCPQSAPAIIIVASFLSCLSRRRLEVGGSVLGVGPPAAAATVWELVTGHLSIRLSPSFFAALLKMRGKATPNRHECCAKEEGRDHLVTQALPARSRP